MLYPYKFTPILAERLWGGRALKKFGKTLPPGKLIGESWEISNRDDAQSVVANGPDAGKTLRQLIEQYGPDAIIGTHTGGVGHAALPADKVGRGVPTAPRRFPLLIKLLDARERLSIQVHPPASVAGQLDGEPKTEMWYIFDAAPAAHLIAGLKRGVTREIFTRALEQSAIQNPKSNRSSTGSPSNPATPCSSPPAASTRLMPGWSSPKSNKAPTPPTGCTTGTGSASRGTT